MNPSPNDPTSAGVRLPETLSGPVSLSSVEVTTLCAKAARGAGLAWGLAEEAGFAAGWLAARRIDGTTALTARLGATEAAGPLLPQTREGALRWSAPAGADLCPVTLGAALSDFSGLLSGDEWLTGSVLGPVLILPFAAGLAADRGRAIGVTWNDGTVTVTPDGTVAGDIARLAVVQKAELRLRALPPAALSSPAKPGTPHDRVAIGGATLRRLQDLALRTTVPPSARSRAGAGSDKDDND